MTTINFILNFTSAINTYGNSNFHHQFHSEQYKENSYKISMRRSRSAERMNSQMVDLLKNHADLKAKLIEMHQVVISEIFKHTSFTITELEKIAG